MYLYVKGSLQLTDNDTKILAKMLHDQLGYAWSDAKRIARNYKNYHLTDGPDDDICCLQDIVDLEYEFKYNKYQPSEDALEELYRSGMKL